MSPKIYEDARAFWTFQPTEPTYMNPDVFFTSTLLLAHREKTRVEAGMGPDNNIKAIHQALLFQGFNLEGLALLFFAAQYPLLFSDQSFLANIPVQQRAKLLERGAAICYRSFSEIDNCHRIIDPMDLMAIQHRINRWGWEDVPTYGLASFLSQIAIEPNEDLRVFEDYTFETEIHLSTFEGPVNLEPLHHLARLFQTPEKLAQHMLKDYKNKIPSEFWNELSLWFDVASMEEVSREAKVLVPNHRVAHHVFQKILYLIYHQHSRRERWRTTWRHFRGRGPSWEEKRTRLAVLAVRILTAITLEDKYNRDGQGKLLGLKKKLKKMPPVETAGALKMILDFFRHEFLETMDIFPDDGLFPYKRDERPIPGTGPSRSQVLALIPEQVLNQLNLAEQLTETAAHWRRTARVDFRPRREILDAFFGVAGNNCTGKAEFVEHALSDPAFQPVRILVDGEFAGSFMTYSTPFEIGNPAPKKQLRALIVSGIDSRFRFDPESFTKHLLRYLVKVGKNGNYDLVLLPKYEGSQSSRDVPLREALQERAAGSFTTKKDVYYPKRGPGNDPERDYHPHSTSRDGYWVLFHKDTA